MGPLRYLAILYFIFTYQDSVYGIENLRAISAGEDVVSRDLNQILRKADLTGAVSFEHVFEYGDYARISCRNQKINIKVYSLSKEWSPTFYYALQKLGFLFPHPRWQISPTREDMLKKCGKKYSWRPALEYRGFHFHTQHPNEWVHGFLQDKPDIASDTIRWLARNQQNVFDLTLLRMPSETIFKKLKEPFKLAKSFGIHTGVTVGMAFHQQNAYKLVSIIGSLSDDISRREISRNLTLLLDNIDLSYINVESGSSEFTPVNYDRTLSWLNQIAKIAKKRNIKVLTKVHISSNQKNKKYGNYNYLPSYASPEVGILPHTVFYYSLNDKKAPMYGNKNFHDMRDFMLKEKSKRRTWYYPETSYFIAMDIGLPLYFTEYLRARSEDMKFIHENGIEGQLNFTTGHELGYWLFDWSVALYNNLDYKFDPMIGLKLLGEDLKVMKSHLAFQKKHFTDEQLVSVITFQNFGDEIFPAHAIHSRILIKNLVEDKNEIEHQIYKLARALEEVPSTEKILNQEIKSLLDITYLRVQHALYVRKAMLSKKEENLRLASQTREKAQTIMDQFVEKYERYPDAKIFSKHKNLSAYQWGYGYTARNLHHWEREEMKVKDQEFSMFFMNVYDPIDIVF
ncbi:MAG: hypothetical protein CME65_07725 [Halobacteriovoraceae bacterium]|nr:hypothetical protein [Halobacteriovoraceae bacterium]|tara:strand:+ start:3860 stop:5734 length:1875 start_codon:yes stop_codon:yes gene_type:complete